ncbi:MAG: glycosyltransferase N-terminal domain-containing protein [Paracoccaceae bacterium]
MADGFPSLRLRLALAAYTVLWWLGLPFVLLYLRRRARRDADYGRWPRERFGIYPAGVGARPVWIHAVSLGEMRSAEPLVRALLNRGESIVLTHFTPAGRRAAHAAFAPEIAAGRVLPVWVPFELGFAWRRFLRHFAPQYGLVMEIEVWPAMIMQCRKAAVPLFMCNAQYPSKSFARDTGRTTLRAELMRGFAGALVKSELQRDRFAAVGVRNIAVTGETRFDQPIPPHLVKAGRDARVALGPGRPVIALASVVEGEDDLYLSTIAETLTAHEADGCERPFFIYVPRAPERFEEVAAMIAARGLRMIRRSEVFGDGLQARAKIAEADILLGNSLGEMYFYLSMADRVIVGGGFTPKGAHNVIEPLALGKPVIVGPEIWTIEYPAAEAIAAGVCLQVRTAAELTAALAPGGAGAVPDDAISAFLAAHAGATERTLAALPELLAVATSR